MYDMKKKSLDKYQRLAPAPERRIRVANLIQCIERAHGEIQPEAKRRVHRTILNIQGKDWRHSRRCTLRPSGEVLGYEDLVVPGVVSVGAKYWATGNCVVTRVHGLQSFYAAPHVEGQEPAKLHPSLAQGRAAQNIADRYKVSFDFDGKRILVPTPNFCDNPDSLRDIPRDQEPLQYILNVVQRVVDAQRDFAAWQKVYWEENVKTATRMLESGEYKLEERLSA